MVMFMRFVFRSLLCLVFPSVILLPSVAAQTAFNDFAPGGGTHTNTTTIGPPSASGQLKNISTGLNAGIRALATSTAVTLGPAQGAPLYATPTFIVFDGYVDFVGEPNPAIELTSASSVVAYTFTGLDPNAEYNFQGTAIRGEVSYQDRWTLFQINGAVSFTSRHSTGTLTAVSVPSLTSAQAAINTGDNVQGELVWWEHIRPNADGVFSVSSRKYTGPVPGGSSGGAAAYGMTGFRIEKGGVYTGRTNVPPRQPIPTPNSINGIRTVFMILMENQNWSGIKSNALCPYINITLLPMASYANQYFTPAGLHPSEPNYLWLVAGDNFGIRNSSPPAINHQSSTNTLFAQLDAAGISWKTYQENISGNDCPEVDNFPYAVRHNPFVFFDSVRDNSSYCISHVRPYNELAADLSSRNIARFNFISPNLTNDMHDAAPGSTSRPKQGDDWLSREVPRILASDAYTNSGALIITWDEGSNDSDGPIGMIVISSRAKGNGYSNSIRYTHSSTVRTLQDIFGVRPYLGDAINAVGLDDLFKSPEIISVRWTNAIAFSVTNLIVGRTNLIQASSELAPATWETIQTNVSTSTGLDFTDPTTPLPTRRFYRVVELP